MDDLNATRIDYKTKGFAVLQYDTKPLHSYPYDAPWISDKTFSALYDKLSANTLVDRTRCYSIYLLQDQIKDLEGDILEVGTWRGGTAGIFTTCNPDRTVYLADTFKGVVKSSEWEHYSDKAHDDTSRRTVEELLSDTLQVDNYRILEGVFPEDTGSELTSDKLAMVYLDVDVYQSTKDAFNYVWDRIVPNGIVIFDDYGMFSACEGISTFINEIKDDKDKIFISNLNGQAYIIKK